MKNLLTILLSTFIFQLSIAQVGTKISIPVTAYPYTRPALLNLPDDYAIATTTRYAFLIFGHGNGERSNTGATDATYQAGGYLNKIYNSANSGGPAYFIEHTGWPSYFVHPVTGVHYKFIVLSPQNDSWTVYTKDIKDIINYMVANYRVDSTRIYITGLSAGGEETAIGYEAQYDIEAGATVAPTKYKPAASVPMSVAFPSSPINSAWAATAVADSVPNWGFGQTTTNQDPFGTLTQTFINQQNAIKAAYSRFTNYAGSYSHCCWGTYYNPSYTEVINGTAMNIYEWMLTKQRTTIKRTSAAVYRTSDSVLLRTLWTNRDTLATTFTDTWDDKDDYGNTVGPVGHYVKVLSSNVTYNEDGIIGNTSTNAYGTGHHRGYYTSMTGISVAGANAYFCQGYSEGNPSEAMFNTSNPQVRVDIFGAGKSTANSDFVVNDGIKVYWAVYNAYKTSNSFIHASTISNNQQASFGANGSVYTPSNLRSPVNYTSVIDTSLTPGSRPTGLAATFGSAGYIFLARGFLNRLDVTSKAGARAQTLSYTNPRYLAMQGNNLWMVTGTNTVAKYPVNSNGTLGSASLTLSGITTPGAIGVDTVNNIIAVIEQATQQVKFFNNSGTLVYTLGTSGGYSSNPDVTNLKYMFNDYRGNTYSFISFLSNGSFWLGDPGNYRELYFDANKNYISYIMSMGGPYSVCADPNNTTRVFGNYLEFAVDYSQPLTATTGWTLTKNWGYNYTANATTKRLLYVTTLSNGRTYGINYGGGGLQELTATGLRSTGSAIYGGWLNYDGSLTTYTGTSNIGQSVTVQKRVLSSFDGSGNPVWPATGTTLITTPPFPSNLSDPSARPGIVSPAGQNQVTASGKFIMYQPSKYYTANVSNVFRFHHLGAIKLGGNTYIWKQQKANDSNYVGPFPGAEYFEVGNGGNQYAGSNVNVFGNHILSGYHGEGWKKGQTNYYNHYYEDGIPIGQFGTDHVKLTGDQSGNTYPTPSYWMEGNALNNSLVQGANDNLYLYHASESYEAGIHRSSLNNLSSIYEQYIGTTPNIPPVASAGADQAITLPTTTATLTGSGTDADGTISSYGWIKMSGPAAGTISSPTSATTNITGLTIAGTYRYRLTVTDNSGATSFDDALIVVSPAATTIYDIVPDVNGDVYIVNNGTYKAGDTLCLSATHNPYHQISFDGLVGTASQPIVIKNCDGQVIVTNDSVYGFRCVNSQFVHLTGTGDSSVQYGFKFTQPNLSSRAGSSINFKDSTSDYEIDHIETYNTENGFLCKIDPANDAPGTWSNGWTIANVYIHDIQVRRTGGEGLYIINTASTVTVQQSGVDTIVEPVKGLNIRVHNVNTDSTGWDGIQVAATTNLDIQNDSVTNFGTKNAGSQQAGILGGGKSTGKIKNCYVADGTGNGLQWFGYNVDTIANNVVLNTGTSGGQGAIFIDDRPLPSNQYTQLSAFVLNNTVSISGGPSIQIFNSNASMGTRSKVYGNLLVQLSGNYYDFQGGVVVDTLYNTTLPLLSSAKFVSFVDHHLLYNSPAVGSVYVDAPYYNIAKDYDGVLRGSPYAAGAYEFTGTIPDIPAIRDFIIIHGKIIFR